MSETLIQLRNIKTQKPYTVTRAELDKMQHHHRSRFEIVGELTPIAVKDSVKFVPSAIEEAVKRLEASQEQKADPSAQA